MTINEKNAYEITKKLAFPRLVGSKGEKEAIRIVEEEFKKAGYDSVVREEFKTSFYSWNLARWVFIPIGLFLVLIAYSFFISYWITLVLIVIFMIVGIKALNMIVPHEIELSRNEKYNFYTENLYVNLESKNSKTKVILMAHYDSKGQTFPKNLSIIIFIVVIFGFIIMAILYLVLSIISIFFILEYQILFIFMFMVCVILAILGSFNYFNKTINISAGATDAAAGVGAIIEMARYFKANPLENIDMTFLATGSEELNLGGGQIFYC